MNYYAIAIGKKTGIYLTWDECSKYVIGYKNAKYKKFSNVNDAEEFYKKYHNGNLPKNLNYKDDEYAEMVRFINRKERICQICGKPFKPPTAKGGIGKKKDISWCYTCKSHKIKGYSLPIIIKIKEETGCEDPFDFIKNNPDVAFQIKCNINKEKETQAALKTSMSAAEWRKLKRVNKKDTRKEHITQQKRKEKEFARTTSFGYENKEKLRLAMEVEHGKYHNDNFIPLFIKKEFGAAKDILKVTGAKNNPKIFYHCKRCDEDYTVYWNNYLKKKGHNCSALISSGEAIIADYLKSIGIKFLTQRDTLSCINPDTGYVMPYDFELPDYKVLIEVQGEQHRTFVERFHVDEEGFLYQKKKDLYKKEFAIKHGYKLIEIWYEDFANDSYKNVISKALM